METIVTGRLVLRNWQESDADDLFEFGKSPSVKMAGWDVLTSREQALENIRSWRAVRNKKVQPETQCH